jgi:crotonobetainyl-CoA:carnitine CoA-transferase CaiB-like acyl-CoA transferase
MILADLGAEVVRVEHPNHPDPIHYLPPFSGNESVAYFALNRSKRSLALDIRREEGRSVFFDLVKKADVVVEQFRPGVLDNMGIGYGAAASFNPQIIYLSLTGFGQDGPYSRKAGHDINYISMAGLLSLVKQEDEIVLPGFQVADVAGGSYMAIIGCMAALWRREKNGKGERVDVAMTDAVLPLLTLQLAQQWGAQGPDSPINLLDGSFAFYGVYRCSDGKPVSLGALEPKFWINFCRMVGREDWMPRQFSTGEEGRGLRKEVGSLFKEKTRKEWLELAEAHDACLSPVHELADIENDPHLRSRQMIIEMDCGEGVNLKGIGLPIKFSGSQPDAPDPAPGVGRDSVEILDEIGYSPGRIEELIKQGIVYAASRAVSEEKVKKEETGWP